MTKSSTADWEHAISLLRGTCRNDRFIAFLEHLIDSPQFLEYVPIVSMFSLCVVPGREVVPDEGPSIQLTSRTPNELMVEFVECQKSGDVTRCIRDSVYCPYEVGNRFVDEAMRRLSAAHESDETQTQS